MASDFQTFVHPVPQEQNKKQKAKNKQQNNESNKEKNKNNNNMKKATKGENPNNSAINSLM